MPHSSARRVTYGGAAAVALSLLAGCSSTEAVAEPQAADGEGQDSSPEYAEEFDRLAEEFDARLGVYALDTATGEEVSYNADDRFAYASTFKPFVCGAVMETRSLDDMDEVVTFDAEDLVPHSPITEEHVDTGISLMEACDATIRYSDNTAANLLFRELDGPEGLQEALRATGDETTQVDRIEVALNEAAPGDPRDTTTPEQFAVNLQEFVFGDTLEPEKRDVLEQMLRENTTGDDLIRAGVPDDWEVGDKTGGGGYGSRNDIGIMWPPDEEPILIAVMSSRDQEDAEPNDALIAQATEVVVDTIRP
ncbi:class A beta-lactamase [Spiractinospora alimapuensis]|uniref:class A beta-lactamase n=1 Tax=Spiractinospora alimapuensis TaxID=2820884 RepID=UPI001EFF10D9|nr:class A beta-lactamase [Spiractinospora alimapuensis]QVQ50871.1 class A beta-lactamase [Spiractinospora alimapuensis]